MRDLLATVVLIFFLFLLINPYGTGHALSETYRSFVGGLVTP